MLCLLMCRHTLPNLSHSIQPPAAPLDSMSAHFLPPNPTPNPAPAPPGPAPGARGGAAGCAAGGVPRAGRGRGGGGGGGAPHTAGHQVRGFARWRRAGGAESVQACPHPFCRSKVRSMPPSAWAQRLTQCLTWRLWHSADGAYKANSLPGPKRGQLLAHHNCAPLPL